MVKAVVHDFYDTFFPKQSQFELPYEYRNRFANIREIREWKRGHEATMRVMHFVLAALIFCVVVSFLWDHIFRLWQKHRHYFRLRRWRRVFRARSPSPVWRQLKNAESAKNAESHRKWKMLSQQK